MSHDRQTDPQIPSLLAAKRASDRAALRDSVTPAPVNVPLDSAYPPPSFDLRALRDEVFGPPGESGLKTKVAVTQADVESLRHDVRLVMAGQSTLMSAVGRLETSAGEERSTRLQTLTAARASAAFMGIICAVYLLRVVGLIGG